MFLRWKSELLRPVAQVLDALLVGLRNESGEIAFSSARGAGPCVQHGAHLLLDFIEMLHAEDGCHVVSDVAVIQFGEQASRHHQPLGDDSAELDGADADGLFDGLSVLVAPGTETAVVQEGVAFVVDRQCRVDFEIDGAVSWAELIASGDDAPGFAIEGDHVEAVGFGDGGGGCDVDD